MISQADLNAIIDAEQKAHETLYSRPAFLEEFAPFLPRKEMLILTGVRRSGKSTLMKLMMNELLEKGLAQPHSVAYINLEDYRLSDSLALELLEKILSSRSPHEKRVYLFLDEVQAIPGWEKWARTIYDREAHRVKIVVSGSNASLLSKEYATLLTGRNVTFRVRPLSYAEYLSFGGKQDKTLEDYLTYGGFPEIILAHDPAVKRKFLRQYFEDIISKDVINRHGIRNSRQVFVLARHLAANAGQKTSFNKLAKNFGFPSIETIVRYVQYLKEAFLFTEVPFHSYSVKDRYDSSRLPKYYVCDNGFISVLENPSSRDHGKRLENAVCTTLAGNDEITYWNEKSEVDFVTGTAAMNVTIEQKPIPREIKGLQDFDKTEEHHKRQLILITPIAHHASGEIKVIKPEDFLKNPAAFTSTREK